MSTVTIPNKSHFKIDEVCGITGIKPYVLRFWESEFEEINPITSSTGTKLFGHKDIDAIFLIKKLLFEDKLTVEQVKREFFINPLLLESSEEDSCQEEIREDESAFTEDDMQYLVAAEQKLQNILSITDGLNLK